MLKPLNLSSLFHELLGKAGITVNGDKPWDMRINDERVFSAVAADGSLGLGESYVEGWWDVDALDEFFSRMTRAKTRARIADPSTLFSYLGSRLLNLQSVGRSQKVAELHYDLGNDFYRAMLDEHMQYTCGYWRRADNLDDAQEAKLDMICQKLQLKEDDRVLELGCGWGGFARFAASRYGCHVTCYNISKKQVAYGREWTRDLPVEIIHGDYRTAAGKYDKIVSIGLSEHVGHKNYEDFYNLQSRCLKDDGLMLQHTIGSNVTKTTSDPWIARYIFPGGLLPSIPQLSEAYENHLTLEDLHNFGHDYDRTLIAWYRNFEEAWPRFQDTYGDRFYRMWKYYLLSCAGAFRSRSIQLWQFVFSKYGVMGGYQCPR